MFNRPFSRPNNRGKSKVKFEPHDEEMAVLEPFLKAPESLYIDVQKAVFDSEAVQPSRRDSLLERYQMLRSERMAEMGKGGERKA
jgi:hypothetical protein